MRNISRAFEKTHGPLTLKQLPTIDWTDMEEIELLFPAYQRAKIMLERSRSKNTRTNIEIEDFELKTPYGDAVLFQDTELKIEPSTRSAMYGANGVGKTALFMALTGGEIKEVPKHLHIHHMQELEHIPEAEEISVIDTIVLAHPFRRVLVAVEEILKAKIEAKEEGWEKMQNHLPVIERHMNSIRGYDAYDRVSKMLRVLGFDEVGERRPLSALSGGLRMRVALASAFFIEPELLLLDEPTNHLDFPSVLWLENRLRGYKGSFILVTHDRHLLDNVCNSVMLLQDQKITYYSMNFTEFEKTKKKEDAKKNTEIDRFMNKNRNVDPSSRLARTKRMYEEWQRKHHERLVLLAGKFTFKDPAPLTLPEGCEKQEDVSLINMKDVRFSYNPEGGVFIFNEPISFDCKFGTRVGVMGPNGAGKSTFLKLLTGKLTATEGEIITNPEYVLAYFGQHSTKELKMDETPSEFMQRSFPEDKEGILVNHLAKTGVPSGVANTRMENLSYSQRSCVIFAKLTYVPPHLLIMDEPTNFLDLDSVDSLIAATNKFTGALLVVTHSRDFLNRCAKQYLSIVPGQFIVTDTMKKAERLTYSFIESLESGQKVDLKSAIKENPGGGSIHRSQVEGEEEESKEAKKKKDDGIDLTKMIIGAASENPASVMRRKMEEEKKAEEEAAKKAAEEAKAQKKAAKKAAIKLDWAVGDKCWAPYEGQFYEAEVTKSHPMLGVTVTFVGYGNSVLLPPSKVKLENPSPAPKPKAAGAKGGKGGKGKAGEQPTKPRGGRGARGGQGQRNGARQGGQQRR